MQVAHTIAAMLRRYRPNESFPPVGYWEGMYFLEDTEKRSYLGAFFVGTPMSGAGGQTLEKIYSAVSANFPAGAFVQIHLLSIPDIDFDVHRYIRPKRNACQASPVIADDQRALLREAVERRSEYFLEGKEIPHVHSTGVRNHRVIQMVSIKFPTSPSPTDTEISECAESFAKFEQSLRTAGINVTLGEINDYMANLRYIIDPWSSYDGHYDEGKEIREQLLPPGFFVDNENTKQLNINGNLARIISVNRFPKFASIGLMNLIIGDPAGINNQFPVPWLISLNIHYPEQKAKKAWFRNKHVLTTMQSRGKLAEFLPRLGLKKQSYDQLSVDLEESKDSLVDMTFNITLYSKDERELSRLSAQMSTYMAGYGMELNEDTEILWPLFWNNLPLFPSTTSTENLFRSTTMPLRAAIQFAPILSDWTGTGNAAMLLETRRGEPFAYDLYDSATNYNALVFAEAGGGKGFFLNTLITDYLALGSKVWCVDIGRSYYKLCKSLNGEFVSFTEDSNICLNPFTFVVDIDDEMDMLKALLAKMAAPTEGLDDFRLARLQESIKAVWGRMGNAATVTEIADYMNRSDDLRIKDIGNMLFPFTRQGQFGHWFDGEANLNFNSNFIVMELEELTQKEHLQQVVLMILMSKIQQEMFLTSDGVKKFAIFDEAWAHFADDGVAKFLNHAYRRFRKYKGSAILAIQSLADLYLHPHMEAVVQNSATRFILKQRPESVDSVVESGKLAIDPYGQQQMKSLETIPGLYSEVMIHTGSSYAVTRLTHPRFNQVLYSTTGDERDLIINAIENGMPAIDAINLYIQQRG